MADACVPFARQTMAHLPFKEDLRTYQFPTFSSDKRPEVAPTEEQLSAARRLVQNMNLSQGALLVHRTAVALICVAWRVAQERWSRKAGSACSVWTACGLESAYKCFPRADGKPATPVRSERLVASPGVDHTAFGVAARPDNDIDPGGDTMSPGGQELLEPNSTPNPALHRFLDAATRRGVDEFAPLLPPDADPLTEQLLGPPLPALPPAAAEALAALPAVFPLKPTV